MTIDEQRVRERNSFRLRLILGLAAIGLLAAAALVFFAIRDGAPSSSATAQGAVESEETVRSHVRDALAKAPDAETCRATLEQLNTFLAAHPERRTAALSSAERTRLEQRFGLDEQELAEVDSPTFTALDAHHLDLCLLLRDAARAQGMKPTASLDQARQAFAWVMREVRLRAREPDLLPAALILRRGWGTAQGRTLVFLSLLHQLRIPGCILAFGAEEAGKPPYHYCVAGALIGKQVYLFDARLGLPLPGPRGEGVATLAQLKTSNGADILPQLTTDPKHPYDVTAEQVKRLELFVDCPLSALAPRMRFLQNDILGFDLAADSAQVAADPELFEHFEEAARELDVPVRSWPEATRALRSFLPRDQGGTDTAAGPQVMSRQGRFEGELIPWHVLPNQILALPGYVGQRTQQIFGQPFRDFYLGPRLTRDLMLRGRFDEATRSLVALEQEIDERRAGGPAQRKAAADFAVWSKQFIAANAELITAGEAGGGNQTPRVQEAGAQVEALWKEGQPALTTLIGAATAEPRGSEVTYHLALCKHEQAERAQARVQDAGGKSVTEDAWREALYWWNKFDNGYALTAEQYRGRLRQIRDLERTRALTPVQVQLALQYLARDLSTAIAARLLHARALVCRRQPEQATALLESLARELISLETSGELAEVEKPEFPGAAPWYLAGARDHVRQLMQRP